MKKIATLGSIIAASFALVSCDVEKTQEGEMPEVEVKGGQLPKYDVDAPDVDVETKTVEVEVPTIDVDSAKEDEIEDGE